MTNFRIFNLNFLQPKEYFFKVSLRGFQLVYFLPGISRMEIIRKFLSKTPLFEILEIFRKMKQFKI